MVSKKVKNTIGGLILVGVVISAVYFVTKEQFKNSAEGFGLSDVATAAESAVSKVVGEGAMGPEKVGKELANKAFGGNSNGNGNSMNVSGNGNSVVGAGNFQPKEDESSKMNELVEMNNLGCSGMLLSDLNAMPEGALQPAAGNGNGNVEGFAPYGNNGNSANGNGEGNVAGFSNADSVGANVEGAITDSRQFPQFPQDQLTANELLPKQESQMFADLYPSGQGSLNDRRDFLTSAHHIGVNTVGQSLRNASRDLRSEIPNPQKTVSVWNQSTIGPDINRKQFEIGMA